MKGCQSTNKADTNVPALFVNIILGYLGMYFIALVRAAPAVTL